MQAEAWQNLAQKLETGLQSCSRRASERRKVAKLLSEQCGTNLPLLENADAYDLERVRFAALKLSAGNWDALCRAIDLAKADWRDLLVAAEFADDIDAHKKWCPTATQSYDSTEESVP